MNLILKKQINLYLLIVCQKLQIFSRQFESKNSNSEDFSAQIPSHNT